MSRAKIGDDNLVLSYWITGIWNTIMSTDMAIDVFIYTCIQQICSSSIQILQYSPIKTAGHSYILPLPIVAATFSQHRFLFFFLRLNRTRTHTPATYHHHHHTLFYTSSNSKCETKKRHLATKSKKKNFLVWKKKESSTFHCAKVFIILILFFSFLSFQKVTRGNLPKPIIVIIKTLNHFQNV